MALLYCGIPSCVSPPSAIPIEPLSLGTRQGLDLRWMLRSNWTALSTVVVNHQKTLVVNGDCLPKSLKDIICQLGPITDVPTCASLLRRCTIERAPCEGERVHNVMIRCGYADNTFLNNLLVQMYGKCGSLQHARAVFDNMTYRNVYSWTIMLATCAQNRDGKEALELFAQMQAEGFEPNKITSICALDACASLAEVKAGQEIHALVVGNEWDSDVVVGNSLVNMYGKCGILDDAMAVFADMPHQNVVSWNTMIAVCAHNGHGKEALHLFGQMQAEGFELDKITSICILNACASMAVIEEGQAIHASIVGIGWETDVVVGTALLNMYSKCRSLDDARAVFAEMTWRDVISWNAMLAACAQNGHCREALQLFGQMQAESFEPTRITSICVLDACAGVASLEEGQEIHGTIVGNGWESDVSAATALVNMYSKCGSLDDARVVFAEMSQRNVLSWSVMIAACAENGHGKEALQLFGQMQAEGCKPDSITFICVLTACSHMGLVGVGRQYFDMMSRDHGISPSLEHYVCMIDLLGRAGQLDKAEELITSMPLEPVASIWLSLLSSCRIHCDIERGARAANNIFDLDGRNASPYVLLANIHAAASR